MFVILKCLDDLQKELGLQGRRSIVKSLDKEMIMNVLGKLYINEENYRRIVRNHENKLPYKTVIPDGYLSRNETVKKYGISYDSLRNSEKNGTIKTVSNNNISFLEIKSIETLIKFKNELEIMENSEEWIRTSEITNSNHYKRVLRVLNRESFDEDSVRKFIAGKKKERYITKKLLNEIIDGKYQKISHTRKKKDIRYEDMQGVISSFVNNYDKKVIRSTKVSIVKLKDLSIAMKNSMDDVLYVIDEIGRKNKIINLNGELYIPGEDIYILLKSFGFFSIRRLGKENKLTWTTLRNNFNEAKEYNILECIEVKEDLFITLEGIEETIKQFSRKSANQLPSIDEVFKERIKLFNNEIPINKEIAKKFILSKKKSFINRAEEDKPNFNRLINAVECLLNLLDKEVFQYESNELLQLIIDNNIKSGYYPIICSFLNYAKKYNVEECKYQKQFGLSLVKQFKFEESEQDDDIYDCETWAKYYLCLKDINLHLEKAINNTRYAQIWLYCLLNITVTWRKKNILVSTPNVKLEEVGIYDFEWFKNGNNFDLAMASKIIQQIKFSLDGVIAFKNKRNLHFNIPLSLKVPVAIAFTICEIHVRREKENILLFDLKRKDLILKDYGEIFNNDEKLIGFKNLKCTRSIITYGFSHAVNTVGNAAVAYKLNSYARSHKDSDTKVTNTTAEYLRLKSFEGGAKEYMYHIVEREAFGFMYYNLFRCLLEKELFNRLSQQEVTELIKISSEKVSPLTLENASRIFVEDEDELKINIFNKRWLNCLKLNNNLDGKQDGELTKLMIDMYKDKAKELVGDSVYMDEFITSKYTDLINSFEELKVEHYDFIETAEKIFNGSNCCYTKGTNCIFDRIQRKEKCPYSYFEKGGPSCLGCRYNLHTVYCLYEVSDKLDKLLDKVEAINNLTTIEKDKYSFIIKQYLSIIVEALVHFQDIDKEYIQSIIKIKKIKQRILYLRKDSKIYNI